MASMGLQLLGCTLALLGWVGVILVCGLPMWRVTAFIGSNIVTSQIFWEGIWMSCVVQSTGQMQCKVYDSMLALTSDLQAARALMVVSLVVGIIGLFMAFIAGKCTNFIQDENSKRRSAIGAGVVLIISGVLCLIPVSWTASMIIRDFYNPTLTAAQKRELGASLYIGWGASFLLIIGGGLLCSSCPRNDDKTPSLKYQLANKARSRNNSVPSFKPPTLRSFTPTSKTYI
ncbi:claudin-4-like [Pygocentrus nattereri]|uniref:claudin-4-like n=1 Tax=Pygocentrus nattereri TaxID=42514 RepID=UPI001890C144|nr:claudin-4-like [Pygocentrus nattereri]